MDESVGELSNSDLISSNDLNADATRPARDESDANDKLNCNCTFSQLTTAKAIIEKEGAGKKMPQQATRRVYQVFVAKYNYDPVQYSPNENPEAELTLATGDYLFIYGEMDEDGFYEGELMNGQRGVVPSNFIEKVPDEDLDDLRSLGSDNRNDSSEASDIGLHNAADMENIQNSVVITEQLDHQFSGTPAPKDLHLERQLANSCIVAWSPPDEQFADQVASYKVFADGILVATVKSSDRTKALIERIDASKNHKISVRAVTECGESTDHQCAITIGRGNRLVPSALDVSDITKTSATISWTAASSYIEHVVSMDGQMEVVTKPGVHRCLITGLSPSITYTVSVTCADQHHLDHNLRTASVSFVTLPKEFPDPPGDVQVEPGPQHATLLITWSPVSNSGLVTGYCVYANGTKVKELTSPTGDHVVLDCVSLLSACGDPRVITVRTSTLDCRQSHDSNCVVLSSVLIEEIQSVSQSEATEAKSEETKEQLSEEVVVDKGNVDDDQVKSLTDSLEVTMQVDEEKEGVQTLPDSRPHSRVPHIEITKDSLSDSSFENCSDHEKYEGTKIPKKLSDEVGSKSTGVLPSRMKPRDYFDNGGDVENGDGSCVTNASADNSALDNINSPIDREPDFIFDGSEADYSKSVNQVRIFIALFEYNPATMSPNSGALEEELPFSEGQLIKVFGNKDADGFYLGEANGLCGLVPCNMVSEVQIDNPDLAEQLIKESVALCREKSRSRMTREHSSKSRRQSPKERSHDSANQSDAMSWSNMGPSSKMMALYDYDPRELSPNFDKKLELSFKAGDVITVFGDVDYDGFYHGELNHKYGLVPSNFLQPFPSDVRPPPQHPHHASQEDLLTRTNAPFLPDYHQNGTQGSDVRQKRGTKVVQHDLARSVDCQEHVRTHRGQHVGYSSRRIQGRDGKFVSELAETATESCEVNVGKGAQRNEGGNNGREAQKRS